MLDLCFILLVFDVLMYVRGLTGNFRCCPHVSLWN